MPSCIDSKTANLVGSGRSDHPTVVVTQLSTDRCHDNIKEETIADAMLDRLVHNAHKIDLKGDSMRKLRSNLIKNRGSEK